MTRRATNLDFLSTYVHISIVKTMELEHATEFPPFFSQDKNVANKNQGLWRMLPSAKLAPSLSFKDVPFYSIC